MPEIPANDNAARVGGGSTGRTWAGNLVRRQEHSTHYLHIYAFPCDKCNGPVIVGSLGTREDHLSKETAITDIGAVCLACGRRPERIIGPSVGHSFRPVEWEMPIHPAGTADVRADSLASELSADSQMAVLEPTQSRAS